MVFASVANSISDLFIFTGPAITHQNPSDGLGCPFVMEQVTDGNEGRMLVIKYNAMEAEHLLACNEFWALFFVSLEHSKSVHC